MHFKYAGIAPVTERSGTKSWVHGRLQCPTCLRQTLRHSTVFIRRCTVFVALRACYVALCGIARL
jgi:Transposase IS116/IS110/IS902 family